MLDWGANVNQQSPRTALEAAIEIIQVLLRSGADPNKVYPEFNNTPLQCAVFEEAAEIDSEVVKILIAAGANVNYCSTGRYPLEVVHGQILCQCESSRESGKYTKVRDVLLQAGADPSLFPHGRVQHAASYGDIAPVRSLISKGEDVNGPPEDDRGATALQYAAMYGRLNIAILLIENGARINAPGAKYHGRTALQAAAENGRLDIVHLLLEHDDEPDLLEGRCLDAAKYAEKEGHGVIAQILGEWKAS